MNKKYLPIPGSAGDNSKCRLGDASIYHVFYAGCLNNFKEI